MKPDLAYLIFYAGIGQLCVLIASALVPLRLDWRSSLRELPALHRQLFWVYGGYVVLSIVSLGLICLFNADELARGSGLARAFCAYAAVFWGLRLSLQPFLAAREFNSHIEWTGHAVIAAKAHATARLHADRLAQLVGRIEHRRSTHHHRARVIGAIAVAHIGGRAVKDAADTVERHLERIGGNLREGGLEPLADGG